MPHPDLPCGCKMKSKNVFKRRWFATDVDESARTGESGCMNCSLRSLQKLMKSGVQFTSSTLIWLAIHILNTTDCEYNSDYTDPYDGKFIISRINPSFIQNFLRRHGIVLKATCGRGRLSDKKEEHIRKSVAYHLGELWREVLLPESCNPIPFLTWTKHILSWTCGLWDI